MEALAAEIGARRDFHKEEAELAARAAHLATRQTLSARQLSSSLPAGRYGGYYAEAAGEKSDVVAAIREHYRPRFAMTNFPRADCRFCSYCRQA